MNKNIRENLESHFENGLIKTRKGNFGQELSYVEGHEYIRRLNDVLESDWTFESQAPKFL